MRYIQRNNFIRLILIASALVLVICSVARAATLEKTSNVTLASHGDAIAYIISASFSNTSNVTLEDKIPESLDYISDDAGGVYHSENRTVKWNFHGVNEIKINMSASVNASAPLYTYLNNTINMSYESNGTFYELNNSSLLRVVPKVKILGILSFQHSLRLPLKKAASDIRWNNTTLFFEMKDPDEASTQALNYDIIFMDTVNYRQSLAERLNESRANGSYFVYFPNTSATWRAIENVNATVRNGAQLYMSNGGEENMRRLLTYLARNLKNANETALPAIVIPDVAAYHPDYKPEEQPCPDCVFKNTTSYMEWYNNSGKYKPGKPFVGVVFYKSYYLTWNMEDINVLIRKIENAGLNVLPVFKYAETLFINQTSGQRYVDIVIWRADFRAIGGVKFLKNLGVPWLLAITLYSQSPDEWYNSKEGISASQLSWNIAQPELDGIIEPVIMGGVVLDNETGTYRRIAIEERIDKIVNRTLSWLNLQKKNNSEKRIALIYYNNPPGKDNIGASYLDIPSSLEMLLNSLYDRGYNLGDFTKFDLSKNPFSDNESLIYKLLTSGRNIGVWAQEDIDKLATNVTLIHENVYKEWFNELPSELQNEVIANFGQPPGNQMVFENSSGKYLVLPNIRFGNVILAPQPYRGYLNSEELTYHNSTLPPNHQYIAFYFWLKKMYRADAIVHVGTHGTLEWLPGKQTGLCNRSWPDILIQDLPNPYIYIMDNVGEGTIAKRRGLSVIIDHLIPPFVPSGLYGNLSALHDTYHLYKKAKENEQTNLSEEYKNQSIELILDLRLDKDLNINISRSMSTADFENAMEIIHEYLHTLQYANMPYGLYIFGMPLKNESLVTLTNAILGDAFKEEINKVNASCNYKNINRTINYTDECSFKLLHRVIIEDADVISAQNEVLGGSSDNVTTHLIKAKEYAYNISISSSEEISRFLDSLEGKYIPPNPGGDPVRKPEALPTGRNFYSFDARTLPTKAAWEIGKKMANETLQKYYEKYGKYPEKVAFDIWATETMRHDGIVHSMALYLLGIEPTWDAYGRVRYYTSKNTSDLKVISESALGRPRIDVFIRSSGLHRDQFPHQIELLDVAARLAASQPDGTYGNYVRKHYLELKDYLTNLTCSESEADNLAMSRVFSIAPGDYGVRIEPAVAASYTWENTDGIAELYLQRISNIYINGSYYETNCTSAYNVLTNVLKNTEVAIFSRSSNLYGVLDGDDPFQNFGGLSLAISYVSNGNRPEMYIANLRDTKNAKIQTLAEFMKIEMRTRLFNPFYIKGLMENGYAGARTLAQQIEWLWGWQVVDPRYVSDDTWNEVYNIFVLDKYSLDLGDFFGRNNPWAGQSIMARMLEAIRKGYWSPSEDVKKSIAEAYQKSVQQYGVTCCHHTCANPFLDNYVSGILSIPVEEQVVEQPLEQAVQYRTGGWRRSIEAPVKANETAVESGVAIPKAGEEAIKPPEETKPVEETGPAKEVVGRIMEEKEKESETGIPISGAPLLGLMGAIAILILIGIGYWLRKI